MIPLLTAGSQIRIIAQAGGYPLPGSTCTLLASPGNQTAPPSNLTQGAELSPMTITEDGLAAHYDTQVDDFEASAGPWTLWLKVLPPSGGPKISPPVLVYVYPSPLPPTS